MFYQSDLSCTRLLSSYKRIDSLFHSRSLLCTGLSLSFIPVQPTRAYPFIWWRIGQAAARPPTTPVSAPTHTNTSAPVPLKYDDTLYTVEKILDKRRHASGHVDYLIKWTNFSDEHNTWEPAGALRATIPKLIAQFNHARVQRD